MPTDAAPAAVSTAPDAEMPAPAVPTIALMSAVDLAKHLSQPTGRIETYLRRLAKKRRDAVAENCEPRRGEARYLYRVGEVWPDLLAKLPAWRRLPLTAG